MNIANKITISRFLLVPIFLVCLLYTDSSQNFFRWAATFIFTFACLTDAIDGFIARNFSQRTHLGALIDPLADKTLLVSAFFLLTFLNNIPSEMRIPPWLTVIVISRDMLLILGAITIYAMQNRFEPHTNAIGKITTFLQMIMIIGILWNGNLFIKHIMIILVAVFTLLSSILYLNMGIKSLSNNGS